MRIFRIIGLVLFSLSYASTASADSSKFQPKGYITNDQGQKCWYKQTPIPDNNYFHDKLTNTVGRIFFDDSQCMKDSGIGLDTNKMMINNVISKWYSHSDADFDTKNPYKTSLYQTKGQCIQSRTYPAIGIAVDYLIRDNSIVMVFHGPTVQGCKN